MRNVTHEVAGDKLIITVDIGDNKLAVAPPSATGKTKLVASTGGTAQVGIKGLTFALNVMSK